MPLAVLTSGGDSAGMNPAVKCVVDLCRDEGETPYLVYDGYRGLIDGKIKEAHPRDVSGIMFRGGTVLGSSRSKRFLDPKYRQQAAENLQQLGIDKLIVIGGDGSFNGARTLAAETGIHVCGIPATIDNDIPLTNYCLGVDTALNMIRQAIDSLRDTAASFRRAFVIEVMGRHCGYLAAMSALCSGAEMCLIPEVSYDLESIGRRIKRDLFEGRKYALAVVAEGIGREVSEQVVDWFEQEIGMESRLTVLGHVQRGGAPSVYDRQRAWYFAREAVFALRDGLEEGVTCQSNGGIVIRSIKEVCSAIYQLDPDVQKLAERMGR